MQIQIDGNDFKETGSAGNNDSDDSDDDKFSNEEKAMIETAIKNFQKENNRPPSELEVRVFKNQLPLMK